MSSISSEASMARSPDKDETSDSPWHLSDKEAADDGDKVKKDAFGSDEAVVEKDTFEEEPAKSDMIADDVAAPNKRVSLADEEAKTSALSAEAQRLCPVTDRILGSMSEVETALIKLHEYAKAQNKEQKPIHQWAKFDGYRGVDRAVANLDGAVAKLEEVHLPTTFVKTYLTRARQISLNVSKAAVFCMGVMNEQFTSYIEETEVPANVVALITEEVRKLLKYGSKATYSVYAALDLLQNSLHIDESRCSRDVSVIKELIAESEARLSAPRKSPLWSVAKVMLGAATSAVFALVAAHMYSTNGFDLALQRDPNSMHSQVLSLVQRAQAVTNLTGEIYSIKLGELDQRYKELEAASESHGLRIDNLVEALGVPNEYGTYFSSTPKSDTPPEMDCQINNGHSYIQETIAEANRQTDQLRTELEHMRKNMHRMDIRLMKRLDKVDWRGR